MFRVDGMYPLGFYQKMAQLSIKCKLDRIRKGCAPPILSELVMWTNAQASKETVPMNRF